MASSENLLGAFSWICDGQFDFGSPCVQRTSLDGLNLFLVLAFFLVLLVGWIRNTISIEISKDWINRVTLVFCALVSSVHFVGACLWFLIASKNGEKSSQLTWLVYFLRGVIWITLTISLLVKGSRWTKIVISSWWIVFFLLTSAFEMEVLLKTENFQALEMVLWLVNFLLLVCGIKTFHQIIISRRAQDQSVSEPLLVQEPAKNSINLSKVSLLSKLLLSWINPLIRLGNGKLLVLEDIPCLDADDEAILAYEKFANAWGFHRGKVSNNKQNFTLKIIAENYWKEIIFTGILALLRTFAVAVSPLLLYFFVTYSAHEQRNLGEGIFLVGCLAVVKVVESLSYRHFFFQSRRIGMRMRSALMVAVYQKQLKLSNIGRQNHSTGEIVNYIAVDAYRMGEFPMWFHTMWSCGIQLFLVIAVLFGIVGIGVLPGLIPLLICGCLNVPFAKILQHCQSEFMVAQDKRLRATSEILNNMKIIKLQSWEENFKNIIQSYRNSEFKWLAESQIKKTYSTVLYWMSPTIVSSVIFFGCVLFGSAPLDAGIIFTVVAALRSMSEPVRMIPEALSFLIQIKVSFDRIDSFLLEDDIKEEGLMKSPSRDSGTHIHVQGAHFSWNPESAAPTLRKISFRVTRGQKVAVCGPVGSGKSSLLYAILGEIPKISGNVDVNGTIAYVSQTSWIQSGTIRDNILFGKPMDKSRYQEAIRVCALDKDIDNFQYGDLTEIGQRGLNMSGGQKQRIQLARAVYSNADIYLLDDPFSAVDAHTAATLFNDCVLAALGKKTVILVTHQMEFLSEVDKILVMETGEVTQTGTYSELIKSETAFEQLVNAHQDAIGVFNPSTAAIKNEDHISHLEMPENACYSDLRRESSEREISVKPGVQLTEDEQKEVGDVGWKSFMEYIYISKGSVLLCSNIIFQAGFTALQAAASYWLAFAIQVPKMRSATIVGVYALVSTFSASFVYLRSLFAVLLGLKASKAFFSGFTDSIFNAPMLFFDSTPIGRIFTRASSDMSILDFDIPFSYTFVMAGGIELVATIGIMAAITWQVLIVGIFAVVASKYVQGYYQASARELMRINGTTKAPVMNYAAETSHGVATIRSFNMVDEFFQNYIKLVDADAKVFFFSSAAMEWLVLRTEALQLLTLFTAACLLVFLPGGYATPGLVGLSLSYAFALTTTQVFTTRWYSSLANYIISVERIKQFMHILAEPPAIVKENRPASSWPSKGRIELLDLKIRYRPNAPIVLKGITCTFQEGTRVGVVGRTGSGKTTLISALFRLVEPYRGKVVIDGVDICSIGLKDLRLKLSIIPQEPTLFKGSVRTNLDPLNLYSDDDIWKALEKCQLKDTISKLPNLLDSSVSDEGENWSMGQRQLFCLGRVLLRRNKILVLDEATASIDSATDSILQGIIREEFPKCTVITVAHRVPTVIDSDMVMVLSFGKLVEYDQPSKLMNGDSSFSKLVAEYWSSCRRDSTENFSKHHD